MEVNALSGCLGWLEGVLIVHRFWGLSQGIGGIKMVYSVIYLTVESSCRNCFYYHHPMAGDNIVLLGKVPSLKTFGVILCG